MKEILQKLKKFLTSFEVVMCLAILTGFTLANLIDPTDDKDVIVQPEVKKLEGVSP